MRQRPHVCSLFLCFVAPAIALASASMVLVPAASAADPPDAGRPGAIRTVSAGPAAAADRSESVALAGLSDFLRAGREWTAATEEPFATLPLSASEADEALRRLVTAHQELHRKTRRPEHDAKRLEWDGLQMKYEAIVYGDRPESGHSLYLSLHGGGGVPAATNDGQWRNQQRLYRLDEGIYVAPRAPTDTWNLWHQAHIDRFLTRLIENMIVFEGVDPDRVFITGYSAGGDGVYQLAPRLADRFAAAAAMAGHPNETRPPGLRNLPFTLHVGENDSGYGRNQQAEKWRVALARLREQDPAGYRHWVKLHAGKGHWMDRQDAEGVAWMASFRRDLTPDRVVWLQDDVLVNRFYWLAVSAEQAVVGRRVEVSRQGNRFTIDHCDAAELTILLRDDFVDLEEPIEVSFQNEVIYRDRVRRTVGDLVRTLSDRGDPRATFSASLTVTLAVADADGSARPE